MLYYDTTRIQFESITFGNGIDANYDIVLTALHIPLLDHVYQQQWCLSLNTAGMNNLKRRSLEANKLCIDCGRPRSGPVYHERRLAKYNCKNLTPFDTFDFDLCSTIGEATRSRNAWRL